MNPMLTLNCGNTKEGGAIPPSISNVIQFPGGSTSTSEKSVSSFIKDTGGIVETYPLIIIVILLLILFLRKG